MTQKELLIIKDLCKQFPGVQALNSVSFSVKSGEVHGLVGANGAGKSTLNKILAGAIEPDTGEIYLDGCQILPLTPKKSQDLGIQVIHQDLNLVQNMSVMENVFLGHEIENGGGLFVNKASIRNATRKILDSLGVNIDPDCLVKDLTISYQQMVAVASAMRRKASVLVLDETTAALTQEECTHLFEKIRMLRSMGLGLIFVSHHIEEVFEICDCVTVLRDGKYMGTLDVKNTSKKEIISLMVGYDIGNQFPVRKRVQGKPLYEIKNLKYKVENECFNFAIKEGEILGFFGLVGAGRTELFRSIFGADQIVEGEIYHCGEKITIKHPKDAVKNRIGFIPEDRKSQGLLLSMSVKQNISLPSIKKITSGGLINSKKELPIVQGFVDKFNIIVNDLNRPVSNLSGGNQQKVVLAKWLSTDPVLLILDQPTRGIDVGAKAEIYKLIQKLSEAGHAIVLISDEIQEILGMCDRIAVMHEGKITGILDHSEANQHLLLELAYGNK
ncbi:sugar ABC transporter ATP-binding protein [Pelolinea submarina]|uniref:Ribose transport system ATP-binding protein n=1 Tax=Pelolinea submarina TaxID=913107 RepID=A0A347ZPN2_9CHLR|nr:sugar ABC transporter ATP-binding protein [Pelolinea submarina]REG04722.1 ribose transport system ATP-binding protein [Pelolinea submarina]BBB47263.1 ribose transport system ATP-binding protein [Pelolinea submarina]